MASTGFSTRARMSGVRAIVTGGPSVLISVPASTATATSTCGRTTTTNVGVIFVSRETGNLRTKGSCMDIMSTSGCNGKCTSKAILKSTLNKGKGITVICCSTGFTPAGRHSRNFHSTVGGCPSVRVMARRNFASRSNYTRRKSTVLARFPGVSNVCTD